jgi:hypothetical protein
LQITDAALTAVTNFRQNPNCAAGLTLGGTVVGVGVGAYVGGAGGGGASAIGGSVIPVAGTAAGFLAGASVGSTALSLAGGSIGGAVGSLASGFICSSVDLSDPKGRTHILDGDQTGGGHRPGTGNSGKSEFPASWSDDKIMEYISDVATDPTARVTQRGATIIREATREGIDIRVIIRNGRIVSGFPTNVPRNP